MNNNQFQAALAKAALTHGIDVDKLRADEKMMLLCIDLYYNGGLDGIHRLSKTMKEKANENVAFPTLSTPTVS